MPYVPLHREQCKATRNRLPELLVGLNLEQIGPTKDLPKTALLTVTAVEKKKACFRHAHSSSRAKRGRLNMPVVFLDFYLR